MTRLEAKSCVACPCREKAAGRNGFVDVTFSEFRFSQPQHQTFMSRFKLPQYTSTAIGRGETLGHVLLTILVGVKRF